MEQLGINLGLLIVQIIAFIIVFLTLNAWVYNPMLNMMESRKQKIAQGLEDARVAAEARANAEKEAAKRDVLAKAGAKDVSFRVDPSILGGLLIRVGDKVLDTSVAGKLEGLRQSLR